MKKIILDDKILLIDNETRFSSGMVFITPDGNIPWEKISQEKFLIPCEYDGDIEIVLGDFYVSKKGNPCFRVSPDGKHYFVRCSWGGVFARTRGDYPFPQNIFYRRKSSRGGGLGCTYWVIPSDWVYPLQDSIAEPEE